MGAIKEKLNLYQILVSVPPENSGIMKYHSTNMIEMSLKNYLKILKRN